MVTVVAEPTPSEEVRQGILGRIREIEEGVRLLPALKRAEWELRPAGHRGRPPKGR